MDTQVEVCPWCGSEISHEQFEDITARIREEEQARLQTFKKQAEAEAKLKAEAEARTQVSAAHAERDAAIKAQQAADKKMTDKFAIMTKELEGRLKKEHDEDLKAQREALDKDREKALLLEKAERAREREAFQAQMQALQRKLENKTANDIGDGAQVNLLDELKAAFPEDRITPIKKGVAGADIRHEVVHKGTVCGTILYDSKARQQWRNDFATKLRDDQLAAEADHAVLATVSFPRGKKELCIESEVVVVSPSRAVYVATILRESLIRIRVLGLSAQQQETKTSRLYDYITSTKCVSLLTELDNACDELLKIEVDEKKAHDRLWEKRGRHLAKLKRQLLSHRSELSNIIESIDFVESDEESEQEVSEPKSIAS